MANDLNRVTLIGRLVREPELKTISSGVAVVNFSIANNRTFKVNGEKQENVSFFNCIAWSKLGELISKYCHKGSQVAIEGRLQQKTWEDQSGNKRSAVEIVVDNCQFLTQKNTTVEKTIDNIGSEVPGVKFDNLIDEILF